MRFFIICLLSLFLGSCSCSGSGGKERLRIGVDPSWSPLNFDELQPYVNGYAEDLLLEISQYSGLEFEKVQANWDSLLDGMQRGQYDAALTSLPPYSFNQAKYDFSIDFLALGPVLVATTNAKYTEPHQLSGELVGVLMGDPAVLLLEKYPEIIIRPFNSVPELLDAVVSGELEAAVLDRLPAMSYVRDLYADQLKIASEPLAKSGLHLIAPKGKLQPLIRAFDKSIERFSKKDKLSKLQKKWHLD